MAMILKTGMLTLLVLGTAALLVDASCCDSFQISSPCCNIFGCNCGGPCWNAGCRTVCAEGKYPGFPVACPGSDDKYSCCQTGSNCKSSCEAGSGGCCCTGGGKQVVSISDIEYDFDKASKGPDAVSAQVFIQYKGQNDDSAVHPVGKIDMSISVTESTTLEVKSETEISATAEVSGGVPFFEKGKFSVSASTKFGCDTSQTKSVSEEITFDLGTDYIPAFSYQSYQFNAAMTMFSIPFTATAVVMDDCDEQSTQSITGAARISGVASFAQGDFTKVVGPAVPIECTPPFKTPIEEQKETNFCSSGSKYCAENALCVRYGFKAGVCCEEGSMLPCCAYAAAHKQCISQGYDHQDVICPSPPGSFEPCCSASSLATVSEGNAAGLRGSVESGVASGPKSSTRGSAEIGLKVTLEQKRLMKKAAQQDVAEDPEPEPAAAVSLSV